ncbi:hypothetical protein OG911_28070 [Streptomyces sp. NBC_00208]|uniref:hypothetical protein n=1 Tax=Streptomyces sp. NBC_00208 TaxID=2975681 RepID=UPI002E2A0964|nr:hypothetical protein [Streptomyces sp. NBC_00208]
MSDLEKATRDAVDAAANTEQLALIAAVLKVQQLTQYHPAPPPAPVVRSSGGGAMKWLAIGMGGSALLLAVAVSAIAVAISAVALTICILILRSVWQDIRKGN